MCVVCLGAQHAQAALEGAACVHCDQLPLRSRRALFEEGGSAGVPRGSGPASAEAGRRLMSRGSQMDVTEGLETGPALSLPSPVASASVSIRRQEARVAVSSAPVDTVTLMASSSEELDVVSVATGESEDPPLQSPASEELMEVLSRAVAKLNIDWPAEKQEQTVRSKLDELFLPSWSAQPPRRALPFFPDLHTEVSRSWKKPVSTRVYTPQTSIYSNVAGMRKHGYGAMPRADETLASHLSPQVASSLKAPTLPTKPLKTTSALVGKAYSAAGQAAACLHTMSILQAYQADLLKDLGESDEVGADLIQELRLTADLALRATKETAKSVGRSMSSLVATERHLWLNLTEIKDKDKAFLLDAPLNPSNLFGDAISSVTDRFQEVKKQSAALRQFLPRRPKFPLLPGEGSRDRVQAPRNTDNTKGRVLLPGVPLRGVGNRVSALRRSPRRARRI
ncbi:hypothetical protein DPX16_20270 [Anabarilius grahami]|uniref:Uncharacterized protein n=1 Tax=Anabarilius grahami TaxID=495550 RepID=A0A3N0XEB3_ANAGA|nr:hypothetical protein DPX16_20270 [Anabarilius grahami]